MKGAGRMKKALKYIIVLAVSAVLTLGYGFTFGGEPSLWFIGLQIAVAVLIMVYFNKKASCLSALKKLISIAVTVVVVFVFSIVLYSGVSSSSLTKVGEFETEVTDITFSGSQRSQGNATVYFKTPEGQEDWVIVNADASFLLPDGPPSRGDRIIIGEYEGLFGDIYLEYIMETDNEKGS